MKRINNYFILAIFIILMISIGSVCAVSGDVSFSNSNSLDDDSDDDFELDEDDAEDDSDSDEDYEDDEDDSDLDDDSDDDFEDDEDDSDLDDDSDDDYEDDEDFEDDEDYEDGEGFDGSFEERITFFALGAALGDKSMNSNDLSGANDNSQNNSQEDSLKNEDLSHQAGNPIAILLLSLLFLIVIPLRNR